MGSTRGSTGWPTNSRTRSERWGPPLHPSQPPPFSPETPPPPFSHPIGVCALLLLLFVGLGVFLAFFGVFFGVPPPFRAPPHPFCPPPPSDFVCACVEIYLYIKLLGGGGAELWGGWGCVGAALGGGGAYGAPHLCTPPRVSAPPSHGPNVGQWGGIGTTPTLNNLSQPRMAPPPLPPQPWGSHTAPPPHPMDQIWVSE